MTIEQIFHSKTEHYWQSNCFSEYEVRFGHYHKKAPRKATHQMHTKCSILYSSYYVKHMICRILFAAFDKVDVLKSTRQKTFYNGCKKPNMTAMFEWRYRLWIFIVTNCHSGHCRSEIKKYSLYRYLTDFSTFLTTENL